MTAFPVTTNIGADLAGALTSGVKINTTESKAGINYLKYDTYSGKWFIGKDRLEVTGHEVLINTQAIGHGWQLWVDQKIADQIAVPFTSDLPAAPEGMEDKRGHWQEPREMRVLAGLYQGDEDDLKFEFSGTSFGIKQAVDTLLNEIRAKALANAEYLYPQVELDAAAPYENPHKKGEMLYNPVFTIVGWANQDGEMEDEPAVQIEAAKEPEPEETKAEEDAAPRRRRRKG